MAGLVKRGDKFSIRFTLHGLRKSLATGTTAERQAARILEHVENILTAAHTGDEICRTTAVWLTTAPQALKRRMAEVGLIVLADAAGRVVTLGDLLARYFKARSDVKASTVTNWNHTKRCLLQFFGEAKPIAEVTPGDARDFERYLRTTAREHRYDEARKSDGLKGETIRKRICNAKQFFRYAVDHRLIESNPFDSLKSAPGANRTRDRFITRDEAAKVLAACPNNQWRLLFALSRFGGLRCPSEHLALRWGDVDLPGGRMVVHSPKTAHHEGKESRVVPIFAELRPYLEQAWDEAEPRAEFVVSRYRDATSNLRTYLTRIVRNAGLKPWPKLWHNLRASRATELAAEFPQHVAAAWLGHSTAVAAKHYWQVTDADFERATGDAKNGAPDCADFVATRRSKALQEGETRLTNTAENRKYSQAVVYPMGDTRSRRRRRRRRSRDHSAGDALLPVFSSGMGKTCVGCGDGFADSA